MAVNVDLCTRVEGEARIEYLVEKKELVAVNFKADVFRGFETILAGKRLEDVPRVASRICGLCHASQAIASSRAVENACGVDVGDDVARLRHVLLAGELIASHATHVFFQGYPDIHKVFHGKTTGLEEMLRKETARASTFFKIIKAGKDACEAIGGRGVHPVLVATPFSPVLPTPKDLQVARRAFQGIAGATRSELEVLLDLFESHDPVGDFSFKNVSTISTAVGKDGKRDGTSLRVAFPNGKGRDVPATGYREVIHDEPGMRQYETPLERGMHYLTGPVARARDGLAGDLVDANLAARVSSVVKKWAGNTFLVYPLQMAEMHAASLAAVRNIDATPADLARNKTSTSPQRGELDGTGVVEAPRGILVHQYRSDDGKVVSGVSLVIATKVNMPLVDAMLTTRCKELHEKGFSMDEIKERASMIVRSFDPCISCATHAFIME